jgi:hypothetical protein
VATTRNWCFLAGGLLGELECHLQEAVQAIEGRQAKNAKSHLSKARSLTRDALYWYPVALLRRLDDETRLLLNDWKGPRTPKDARGRASSALQKASWVRTRAGDLCGR